MIKKKNPNEKKLELTLDSSKKKAEFITQLYSNKKNHEVKVITPVDEDFGSKKGKFLKI